MPVLSLSAAKPQKARGLQRSVSERNKTLLQQRALFLWTLIVQELVVSSCSLPELSSVHTTRKPDVHAVLKTHIQGHRNTEETGHFQNGMIWVQLVDILYFKWTRMKTDMLPLWFSNCVTERVRDYVYSSQDMKRRFTHSYINQDAERRSAETCITSSQEHINKLTSWEPIMEGGHRRKQIQRMHKLHFYNLIGFQAQYFGIMYFAIFEWAF